MSWSKFTIVLIAVYAAYYLLMVLMDLMKSKTVTATTSAGDELTFSEDVQTTEVEHFEELVPVPIEIPDEFEEGTTNAVWEREDEDTEELNIISHNINTSTGGTTSMSEVIKLAQNNTIDYKRQIVF
ncbi:hypothetical protein HH214_21640 (plasmid) [Mucilaginibacter robiniae]|uniref:Uncharacterized protein n=1 Tax=Mucilaginibacter robiniae TaxID=2728022 RepID=A0A7L5E5K3_9SPHI|nr:hypothetical protein [Mucilaginibacter robiniae]QJD98562.1 hypothetical protein HH214_21640 [Mucilaginibacter robiniae]